MRPGDTFLNAAGRGVQPHLWLVLSDPQRDPEQIVIANLNTLRQETPTDESGCLLQPGDHPFVNRPSYVNFAEARVVTL